MTRLMRGSKMVGKERLADTIANFGWDLEFLPQVLKLVVGKEWSKVPLGNMMEIVSKRFDTKPHDFSHYDAKEVINSMVAFARGLSKAQLKFLHSYDHLPRSNGTQRLWLDGEELAEYEKKNEALLDARKMEQFILTNGWIQAAGTTNEAVVVKVKKINPFYVLFGAVVLILLTALLLIP